MKRKNITNIYTYKLCLNDSDCIIAIPRVVHTLFCMVRTRDNKPHVIPFYITNKITLLIESRIQNKNYLNYRNTRFTLLFCLLNLRHIYKQNNKKNYIN